LVHTANLILVLKVALKYSMRAFHESLFALMLR
jgi:hypothetical protein